MRFFLVTALSFLFGFSSSPLYVYAQSQSLSVTPPLFQLSVEPGDIWQSTIKAVNSNPFPLTVYAQVVNFAPEGEDGLGKFTPLLNRTEEKTTLAEWIEIAEGPHIIPAEQTQEISFFIEVPDDAPPGGHFAAILVGTEPSKDSDDPLAVVTSQSIASLFFVRISGDVIENASIREFSILDRSIEEPTAEFSLRLENKGNVHIQPRGDIVISNMWGKVRGVIPINHDTHFGNVLPNSIRNFNFSWTGEKSLADIGLYKAIVTLGYGEGEIKSISSIAYFWIIPIKGALLTLTILGLFVYAIVWMIKRYVRNMLLLAGVDPDAPGHDRGALARRTDDERRGVNYKRVTAPLKKGTLDLKNRISGAHESMEVVATIFEFVRIYKGFFISLFVLIIGFITIVFYIQNVATSDTHYEVTIDEGDTTRVLTSEEIEVGREVTE